jgi:hypothetical protein
MLKSAKDIQQLSEEAKLEALEKDRKNKIDDENLQLIIRKKAKDQLEFQLRAIDAAKEGNGYIAVTNLLLDTNSLESLGFVIHELTSRTKYENWLSDGVSAKRLELEISLESMLSACPSFRFISEQDIRFRNPLMSLFENLWLPSKSLFSEHQSRVFDSLYSTPKIDFEWIDSNRLKLESCLNLFLEFKKIENKLRDVEWANKQIPESADSCLLVEWDSAPTYTGLSDVFNASLVQWFAQNWEDVSLFLSSSIEFEATKGKFCIEFVTTYDGIKWWIYSTGEEHGQQSTNPLILINELKSMGYIAGVYREREVNVYQNNISELIQANDEELRNINIDSNDFTEYEKRIGYILRVCWDS